MLVKLCELTGLIFSDELDDTDVLLFALILIFLIVCTAFSILLANKLRRLVVGVFEKSLKLVAEVGLHAVVVNRVLESKPDDFSIMLVVAVELVLEVAEQVRSRFNKL